MIRKIFINKVDKIRLVWKYPIILLLSFTVVSFLFTYIMIYGVRAFLVIKKGTWFEFGMIKESMFNIGMTDIAIESAFIVVTIIFARYIDKFTYRELGLQVNTRSVFRFISGILIAGVCMLLPFIVCVISGITQIKGLYWDINTSGDSLLYYLVYQAIVFMFVAYQEELLCRAYLIRNLWKSKPYIAILVPSLIFSLQHIVNLLGDSGSALQVDIVGLINIYIIGIVFGYYFYYTGDLWLVIGAHFSWNFCQGPILGLPISNVPGKGILVTRVNSGYELFSGGQFGPEGGILVTIALILMLCTIRYYVKKFELGDSIHNFVDNKIKIQI